MPLAVDPLRLVLLRRVSIGHTDELRYYSFSARQSRLNRLYIFYRASVATGRFEAERLSLKFTGTVHCPGRWRAATMTDSNSLTLDHNHCSTARDLGMSEGGIYVANKVSIDDANY